MDVDIRQRLVKNDAAIEEELRVPSLKEDREHFESAADCFVDVKVGPDCFVSSNLGDYADGRFRESTEILHCDRFEPDPVAAADGSDLSHFPVVRQTCGVSGLFCSSGDDVISE